MTHGCDHAGLDAPFDDQQVAMQAVDYISQLKLVTQLVGAEATFDYGDTGSILHGYQTFAFGTGRPETGLVR